jgi:hypothetical protein
MQLPDPTNWIAIQKYPSGSTWMKTRVDIGYELERICTTRE